MAFHLIFFIVFSLHTRGRTVTTEVTYKCCPGSRRDLEKDVCVKGIYFKPIHF